MEKLVSGEKAYADRVTNRRRIRRGFGSGVARRGFGIRLATIFAMATLDLDLGSREAATDL